MKKTLKVLGVIIFSAFLLLPLKTFAATPEWSTELDLGDSVSSSIAKVEDGVIVMQYEGSASAGNLLTKYDLSGNKVWEIDNDYGYNISSVSDGFIVWSERKITKFDKDKNIIWSKSVDYNDNEVGGLGSLFVEFDDGYVIGSQQEYYDRNGYKGVNRDFFKISLNGEITKRISSYDLVNSSIESTEQFHIIAIGKSLDGKSLVVAIRIYSMDNGDSLYISLFTPDLEAKSTYKNDITEYDSSFKELLSASCPKTIVATNKGYILTGEKILTFDSEGKLKKLYNKALTDVVQIDDYIYGYLIQKKDSNTSSGYNYYKASIVKYDQNLKQISKMTMPFSFTPSGGSAVAQIKDRTVYYKSDDQVYFITINSNYKYIYRSSSNSYETIEKSITEHTGNTGLIKYKYIDNDKETDDSGIINDIMKNPQTNSIIIISVFIVLVLIISAISYVIYRKKNKKAEII